MRRFELFSVLVLQEYRQALLLDREYARHPFAAGFCTGTIAAIDEELALRDAQHSQGVIKRPDDKGRP